MFTMNFSSFQQRKASTTSMARSCSVFTEASRGGVSVQQNFSSLQQRQASTTSMACFCSVFTEASRGGVSLQQNFSSLQQRKASTTSITRPVFSAAHGSIQICSAVVKTPAHINISHRRNDTVPTGFKKRISRYS